MHYRLEIVMPPVENVEAAVASIMDPFDENGDPNPHAFWDWYVIGGRFAGSKRLDAIGRERVQLFWNWLKEENVTVSGLCAGKQELKPETQIPKVDAKWNEMFPEASADHCPLFMHSNNPYGKGLSGTLPDDICPLEQCKNVTAERVIFAAPSFNKKELTGPIEPSFMLQKDFWNGVNFAATTWDGTLNSGIAAVVQNFKDYSDECQEAYTPKDDWLVVTVDYHD